MTSLNVEPGGDTFGSLDPSTLGIVLRRSMAMDVEVDQSWVQRQIEKEDAAAAEVPHGTGAMGGLDVTLAAQPIGQGRGAPAVRGGAMPRGRGRGRPPKARGT